MPRSLTRSLAQVAKKSEPRSDGDSWTWLESQSGETLSHPNDSMAVNSSTLAPVLSGGSPTTALLLAVIALVSSVELSGQLSLDASAATDITFFHQVWFGSNTYKVPAKSRVKSPTFLGPTGGSGVGVSIQHSAAAGRIAYQWSGKVLGSQNIYSTANGSISLHLKSTNSVPGRLLVTFKYSGNLPTGKSRHSLTSPVFSQPISLSTEANFTKVIPITLDSRGVKVTHQSGLLASYISYPKTMGGSATLSLEFVPNTWFQNYGTGCGPQLSGRTGTSQKLLFRADKLVPSPSGVAALFFGLRKTSIQIPGTSCFVLTELLVGVPISVDSAGTATKSFSRPKGHFEVNAQAASLDTRTGGLKFSDGLRITLH